MLCFVGRVFNLANRKIHISHILWVPLSLSLSTTNTNSVACVLGSCCVNAVWFSTFNNDNSQLKQSPNSKTNINKVHMIPLD